MKQVLTFGVLVILCLLTVTCYELVIKIAPIVLVVILVSSTGWVLYKLAVRTVCAVRDIYGD